MRPEELPYLVQRFFTDYLTVQRNLSAHTRSGYRDTFRLLLPFLSRHHRKPIDQLTLGAVSPEAVLAFLAHLESVRGNTARTRNLRLAAIRTFVRFVLGQPAVLDFIGVGHRLLAIPQKKSVKPVLGFMTRAEIDAVLAATDSATSSGRRDRLLFTMLYNTGARISEALQLRPQDLRERAIQIHGKDLVSYCTSCTRGPIVVIDLSAESALASADLRHDVIRRSLIKESGSAAMMNAGQQTGGMPVAHVVARAFE